MFSFAIQKLNTTMMPHLPKSHFKTMLMALLLFSAFSVSAQSKLIGHVSDSTTVLPGVSVINKTTGKAVATDLKGIFNIQAMRGNVLEIKYIGYRTQTVTVTSSDTLKIKLHADARSLNEVVVTALNIKKEKKALGYAVQEVKGDDLVKAREPSAVISLTGKVAGLQITPSTDLFANPGISLRGQTGVLIVVDGVPISTDSWNLTPDDIESYSVLKGANAAALYGSRAVAGAIMITTKRGSTSNQKFKVDFNSSNQLQTGYNAVPKIQTSYGPGDNFKYAFKDGRGGGVNDNDYFIWGPRFEGQLITQYNSPTDPATGQLVPLPWLARGTNNLKNFLQNGLLSTNNMAISTKSDLGDLRFSMSNTYQRGTVPNTRLNITNFSINGGINAGKKVRFDANINYNIQNSPNYPRGGYGSVSPVYLMTIWSGADYDVRDLRNYWQPGKEGIQQYNREYTIYNNPYLVSYEQLHSYGKDDIYGYVQMHYNIVDKLQFNIRTNVSTWNKKETYKFPVSGNYTNYGINLVGGYQENYSRFWENNTEASLSYEGKISPINYKAAVYGNLRTVNASVLNAATNGGLIVPGVYDLSNTVNPSLPTNDFAQRQVQSAYGLLDMDYKGLIYLSLTGRFDKSSTMPVTHDTYFYPSASLSGIISDMVKLPKAISFFKVRGSYANIAADLVNESDQYNIYKLLSTYSAYSTRWNNNTGVGYSSSITDPNLEASRVKTFEVGTEIRFLNNRLGIDAAAFRNIEGPGIVSVSVSPTSGVASVLKNANTYLRKGLEFTVDGTPVKTEKFGWTITGNWSTNHRWLQKIDGIQQRSGMIKIGDRVDGNYYADFQRDKDGNPIMGSNGLPAFNPYQDRHGYTDNNFIAGINNSFRYKGFNLSFQFDGRFGGMMYNYVDQQQWSSGTQPDSDSPYRLLDWNNRNNTAWKGSVMTNGLKIVSGQLNTDQDGKVVSDTRVFAKNDVPVLYQTWARNYIKSYPILTHDATFVKLREVVLTYNLPAKLLSHTGFIHTASVSLVGRNLLYFTGKGLQNLDLDQFTTSSTLQTPSVKSFGVNLNASF